MRGKRSIARHFLDIKKPLRLRHQKGLLNQISEDIMTAILEKLKLDTGYDYEINEGYRKKTGFLFFEQGYDLIQAAFVSDEHGNIQKLGVIEALKDGEEPMQFEITDEIFNIMRDQIEPMLWGKEPYEERDSMSSLGFTNPDFLYG